METDKLVRYFGSTLNAPVARMINDDDDDADADADADARYVLLH